MIKSKNVVSFMDQSLFSTIQILETKRLIGNRAERNRVFHGAST